jgi:hypothetical protein
MTKLLYTLNPSRATDVYSRHMEAARHLVFILYRLYIDNSHNIQFSIHKRSFPFPMPAEVLDCINTKQDL